MRLQPASENKRGFTLIEVLVAMGLVAILFVAGSFMDINSIGRELVISEHVTLVSTLQKARSRAMNNIHASAHGVHIENDSFVIFRKFPYDVNESTNEEVLRNENIGITGLDEVIFKQLSGETSDVGNITLSDGIRSKDIEIIDNGMIDW